jgi:hypothetical protein
MIKAEQSAFWKQHDDDLRRYRADGLTFAEIASLLGVTRSAVLGRAHRTGLSGDEAARQTKREGAVERRRARIARLREQIAGLEKQEAELRTILAELEAQEAADTSKPGARS